MSWLWQPPVLFENFWLVLGLGILAIAGVVALIRWLVKR